LTRGCASGYDIARQSDPWPESRAHALVKAGLACLLLGEHGNAESYFQLAEHLLEEDTWMRWPWHIVLLRGRGELALAEGRLDDAWSYAAQSLALTKRLDSRKHMARAQLLQGDTLLAHRQAEEASPILREALDLARRLNTPARYGWGKPCWAGARASQQSE